MCKILVVDDERSIRELIKEVFANETYTLLMAENGSKALELFEQESPELILLDLQMPVMDGFEFLEQIKPTPDSPFLVIVLTGCDNDENLKRCFKLGAGVFIRKPIVIEELKRIVKGSIELRNEYTAGL